MYKDDIIELLEDADNELAFCGYSSKVGATLRHKLIEAAAKLKKSREWHGYINKDMDYPLIVRGRKINQPYNNIKVIVREILE